MADRIRVSTEALENLAMQIRALATDLDAVKSEIRAVRMDKSSGANLKIALPSRVIGSIGRGLRSGEVQECLGDIASAAQDIGGYGDSLVKKVNQASELFRTNEERIIRSFEGLLSEESMFAGVCQALGYGTDSTKWTPEMHEKYQKLLEKAEIIVDGGFTMMIAGAQGFLFGNDGLLASCEIKDTFTGKKQTYRQYGEHGWSETETQAGANYIGRSTKKSFVKQNPVEGLSHKKSYDKNGKEVENPKSGLAVGLASVGVSAKKSASYFAREGARDGKWVDTEGSVHLLHAEASASANAGFGVYIPNEKGELEYYFGGTGEVGASACVAQTKGSLEFELCDFIEVGTQGEVTIGEVGAKAKGSIGVVGGSVAAYGEAKLEAIAAKAEGSVRGNLAGVEGKVGGSVSFGVGAHAKGGYKDGVLSVDVGVAVGLGVSGYFEVDVSGLVDNVAVGVENTVNAISDLISECAWW
ncbi:MAG: hypothetical protein IKJ11_03180 [Clostridia bacterium]|nr:hypothetical protein [Clostridia bacterium]